MRRLVAAVLFVSSLALGVLGLGRFIGIDKHHVMPQQQAQCGLILGSVMGWTPAICINWFGPLN